MKKADKSVKFIITLIVMILAFVLILALLVKFNVIIISEQGTNNPSYSDNIKKEELCKGIWYYYDEGISAYILVDETGTERQVVREKDELEYYKEDPERLFDNTAIFLTQDNEEELEEETIEE